MTKPKHDYPERIKQIRRKSRRVVKYGPDNPRPPPKPKPKKKRRLSEFHRQALKERARAKGRERDRQRLEAAKKLGVHRVQGWVDGTAYAILCDLRDKTGQSISTIINTLSRKATIESITEAQFNNPAHAFRIGDIAARVAKLKENKR